MSKIKIIGGIPDDSITTNFDNLPSSTLYKLGDYRVETNVDLRKIIDYSNRLNNFSEVYTLEKINLNKTLSEKLYNSYNILNLNVDFSKISKISNYGSLYSKFEYSILNIVENFPYSLYLNNIINNTVYNTVINNIYDNDTNTSNFDIPSSLVNNVGNLIVDSGNFSINNKNFNLYKENYVLRLNEDLSSEYKIIGFTGNLKVDTYINITVVGKPFNSVTASKKFHLKPNEQTYFEFINDLTDLEKYFLSDKKTNRYVIKFTMPKATNNEITDTYTYLEWYFTDGYNIDNSGLVYKNFLQTITKIGLEYDQYKTDIIYRMYTTDSLKIFDQTDNNGLKKIQILNRTYGETFDYVKQYIDGLAKLNTIDYNKNDSVPDILIKNLSRTLGWDYRDILSEENLLENIFKYTQGDISKSTIPSEINIELWRRIINNSVHLFKSKGTRNSIYTFFRLIGLPDEFITLNEYIYLIDSPIINTNGNNNVEIEDFNNYSYNSKGYPISPPENKNFYFQVSGNTDIGQTYLNRYRNDGFNLNRISDNKKVWVYSNTQEIRNSDESYYEINNSDDLINTKEINVGLNASNAEIYKIYNSNSETITFNEYLNKYLTTLIDVKNRKIISDNLGGMYPKLSKIYYDYSINNNNFNYINLYKFIKKFDKYFVNFLNQLIPATVIYRGLGLIVNNSSFIKQKYKYIRGINDGSEFIGNTSFLSCNNFIISNLETINATGNNLGSMTVTVSGGNEPYFYSVNNEIYQESNNFNNLESGNYNIYIKDNIGCTIQKEFSIELECNIIITEVNVEMNIPIIEVTPIPTQTKIPIIPTLLPTLTPNEKVCPIGLVETTWSGPYTSSNEACIQSIYEFEPNITLYINQNAVRLDTTVSSKLVTTAWINCFTAKPSPAISGYYSNGIEWIYVSNVASQIGTNVSAGNVCPTENIV